MSNIKKTETYVIPEVIDGEATGRKIVHQRGSLSERWNLIKGAADTPDEKRAILDIEFRNLKKKMVKYNKVKGAFTDGYGEVFSGPTINKKNNYVRAAANLLTDDVKLINKLLMSPGWEWKSELDEQIEADDARNPEYWSTDQVDPRERKRKRAVENLKILNQVKPTQSELPKPKSEQIKLYALPEPSVKEIIENRVKLKDSLSGIRSLNPNRSTGLNYLVGQDDEIT